MFEDLTIDILLEIYKHIPPEEAPTFALINKHHDELVSNLFWQRKFATHFSYLLQDLPNEKDRNWYLTFRLAYEQEYANLTKNQCAWFSLVKEGKASELHDLSMADLYLEDVRGNRLYSWAKNHLNIVTYFWREIVVPFFTSDPNLIRDGGDYPILHWAARLNQVEHLQALLATDDFHVNTNTLAASNMTVLHSAAEEGHVGIVKLLLKLGADIDATTTTGATALLLAIENNHPEMVDVLLTHKANVSLALKTVGYHLKFKLEVGDTPLHAAVKLGRKGMVERLLDEKAEVNGLSDSNTTPLHCAAEEGQADILQLLLNHGADINATTKVGGATALLLAIENNHPEVVDILLAHKANSSIPLKKATEYHLNFKLTKGDAPLYAAVKLGHKGMVERLLEKAEVNGLSDSNMTPLHCAAEEGQADILRLLLNHGADIDARIKGGATALLLAIENNHPEVVDILLAHKANSSIPLKKATEYHLNFKLTKGDTPLHAAVKLGRKGMVERLLDEKAEVNGLSDSNMTPLHCAAEEGQADILRLLLNHGADIDATTKGGATALLLAIENNHPEVVDILLAHKANSSIPLREATQYHRDFNLTAGDTPFHAAVKNGRVNMIKKLMQSDTFEQDIEALNSEGESPLSVADSAIKPFFTLVDYSTKRSALEGDFKIISLCGIPLFERTFTLFGHRFGCTKQEKLDAERAVRAAVMNPNHHNYSLLQQHQRALENGELGDIFTDLCEAGFIQRENRGVLTNIKEFFQRSFFSNRNENNLAEENNSEDPIFRGF